MRPDQGAFDHFVNLLNTVMEDDAMDFWMILGDNFYDQTGEKTKAVFDALNRKVKQRFVSMVIGTLHTYSLVSFFVVVLLCCCCTN